MPDIIITPSTGKLEFVDNSSQNIRRHAFSMDDDDGIKIDAPFRASSVRAPLNIINVNVDNSNTNYPFVLASGSAETGIKTLMMDGSGGTYNPFTNTATIDISGNSTTTTLASNSTNLGGVAAASYVTLTGTQTLTNKTITGTFTGNLTGTGSWATNAVNANTATNSTQLNGQSDSYYTNIPARLGYTPVNKAGDTVTGNLIINGNFTVNGATTLFSASNVYISSSQLYIEDNILTLNAFSPYLRYAGVEMYDSGSGTLSSLLWDGEADYFFLSGSSVNGKIITGPDGQTNLSSNFVPKATAGYKLGNSLIYDNGTNVGIGTTSPVSKLHIEQIQNAESLITLRNDRQDFGDVAIFGITAQNGVQSVSKISFYRGGGGSSGYLTFSTKVDNASSLTEKVRIDGAGNVGIGTSGASAKLTVQGNLGFSGDSNNYIYMPDINQGTGSIYMQAGFGSAAAGGAIKLHGHNATTYTGGDVEVGMSGKGNFLINSYIGGTRLVTVKVDGNVGIGTTSPGYKLDVNGNSAFRDTVNFGPSVGLISWGSMGGGTGFGIRGESGRGFSLGANGSWDYLVINTSGNVGIGITSPTTKLHVVGVISGSSFSGAGTGLTGTAASLTAGTATIANGVSTGAVKSGGLEENSVITSKIADGNVTNVKLASSSVTIGSSAVSLGSTLTTIAGLTSVTSTTFVGALTGNASTATNSTQLGGIAAASYVTLTGTETLTNKTITGTFTGNLTGNASTSTTVNGTNGQLLFKDIRAIAPNNIAAGYLQFGFTTWTNTLSTTPYADYLHLRSYTDSSGGNDNLVMFRKDAIGMRIWQQTFGSATNYSSYKDVCWTDGTNASGTWAITSSWATNAVTALNGGVTSIVAGTSISVSSGTGAVTVNNTSPNATHTGDVTGATSLTIANDAVTTVKILNANVTNAKLANSSVTIGSTAVSLGATVTTFAGLTSVTSTTFVGALTGNVTGNVTGTAGSETFATVTGRGASTTTQISVGTAAGGSMYTGIKSGAGYSDAVSGATFKSITDHPTGGSYAFASYYSGSTGINSFFVAADGTGYFKGNVGIGTTTPAYKLEVATGTSGQQSLANFRTADTTAANNAGIQIYATPSSTAASRSVLLVWDADGANASGGDYFFIEKLGNSGQVNLNLQSNAAMTFQTNGTERMRITSAGNVGIGTTTDTFTLNVYNNADVWHAKFGSATGELRIGGQTSSGAVIQSFVPGSGTVRDLYIQRDGGNVGIGTSNATAKLESYFASNALTINYLATNLNGNSPIPTYGFSVTDGSAETRSIKAGIGYERHETNGRGTLHFYNRTTNDTASISGNRSSAGDIKMSLNNNGNVGIGTTSPTSLLHLAGVGGDGVAFLRIAGTASDAFNWGSSVMYANLAATETAINLIGKAQSQYNCSYIGYRHVADGSALNMLSLGLYAADHLVNILGNGNVGIGSTAPNDKLDVVGRVYAYRYIAVSSNASLPAYATDTNTGMFNAATNQIGFSISSAEKVRIDSNGNVGIGTTVPGKKLDVEGIVRTRGASGTGGFEIGAATTGAAKWRIEWDSASDSLDFNWVG